MAVFEFRQYGINLGTRQLGAKVRECLLQTIQNNEFTVLDFTGVNVVANSFADECLGKLLLYMTLDELKKKTTFKAVNEMAATCISAAITRRNNYLQK